MVSTALYLKPEDRMLYRDQWNSKELRLALEACRRALRYVGESHTDIHEDGSITAVIRRLCKDDERKRVIEKYR